MKKVLFFILGIVAVIMASVCYYMDVTGNFEHMVRFGLGSILMVAGLALMISALPSKKSSGKYNVRDSGIVASGKK